MEVTAWPQAQHRVAGHRRGAERYDSSKQTCDDSAHWKSLFTIASWIKRCSSLPGVGGEI